MLPATSPSLPMRSPVEAAGWERARLGMVSGVVFLANAGLLVLQLVAGRLLAPWVGSSLETWTTIIGAFLLGIATGNAVGGWWADRRPSRISLAGFLGLGAITAALMPFVPGALEAIGLLRAIPLTARIPLLALAVCFPTGFVLSLITPLAVKLGLRDVTQAGRVTGRIFALGSLGSLVGNYLTGFVLIPLATVNTIVMASAGLFALLGLIVLGWRSLTPSAPRSVLESTTVAAQLSFRQAATVVVLASFAGMTLEITAARLLAQILGVSLYTWTGVIGVMLAGTAIGNNLGGWLADRSAPRNRIERLAMTLVLAGGALVATLVLFFVGIRVQWLDGAGLIPRVLGWTFALFFTPMLLLGMVSPQVIRLAVPDVGHVGRIAGRVYAWSTAGAIAGTFAAGYLLVSSVGMYRTVLIAAALPCLAAMLIAPIWQQNGRLYLLSLVLGSVFGGMLLLTPENTGIALETNYYTIRVLTNDTPNVRSRDDEIDGPAAVAGPAGIFDPPETLARLQLDMLVHSRVKLHDPRYLFYRHEQIHLEWLRLLTTDPRAEPKVLVVGGGGYTFPRCARTLLPQTTVDVVEIDPGVTDVSRSHLALDPNLAINSYHLDGRQFLVDRAPAGHYDLITLDAVNDLTVPYHLLTREFHDIVRKALAPRGVYLLTVIDILEDGKLWRSAVRTLRETFPYVEVLSANPLYKPGDQQVYVIYASDVPLDLERLRAAVFHQGVAESFTQRLPEGELERLFARDGGVLLTDQYAPIDNLMASVFRRRKSEE